MNDGDRLATRRAPDLGSAAVAVNQWWLAALALAIVKVRDEMLDPTAPVPTRTVATGSRSRHTATAVEQRRVRWGMPAEVDPALDGVERAPGE